MGGSREIPRNQKGSPKRKKKPKREGKNREGLLGQTGGKTSGTQFGGGELGLIITKIRKKSVIWYTQTWSTLQMSARTRKKKKQETIRGKSKLIARGIEDT